MFTNFYNYRVIKYKLLHAYSSLLRIIDGAVDLKQTYQDAGGHVQLRVRGLRLEARDNQHGALNQPPEDTRGHPAQAEHSQG